MENQAGNSGEELPGRTLGVVEALHRAEGHQGRSLKEIRAASRGEAPNNKLAGEQEKFERENERSRLEEVRVSGTEQLLEDYYNHH